MKPMQGHIYTRFTTIVMLSVALATLPAVGHAQNFNTNVTVTTGNSPTVQLNQSTAGGFPARTWEVTGNETLFFVRDVTGGKFPLEVAAGVPTNSLFVNFDGKVGLGTENPQGNLHIFGAVNADTFNAIGPDPSSNSNAFNFGYAGFSFGLGSGFFNVRPAPGSAAPNHSLRFAAANV